MPPQRRAARPTAERRDPRAKKSAAKSAHPKPTVVIVGAGRLGSALAVALEACGYHVVALVARQRAHARRAARLLHAQPLALAASELAQLPASDILIIATPDDQIAATAARLAAALPVDATLRGDATTGRTRLKRLRVALHVSGALSSDALAPLRARGFAVGSLHPLVSVSDPRENAKDFRDAFYCVEGDADAVRAARQLVRSLGGQAFNIAARDKALYHASAVMVAGHAVALFDLATELLTRCGLTRSDARRALVSLARGTLSNLAHARTNADALTGPFARADAATIRRHVKAISSLADERDALAAYVALGRRSLLLAAARGAGVRALEEIRNYLNEIDGARR
ncbi:MAG: hypothetical protein QOF61_3364 [Acidobacteriota bacterium]|jgi:predicted short-subunit dehydrogenase-like oxidoreductase (DUF2520 family)|nr:hypothetical protein [Acidobacteriota bacterium]